MTVAAEGERHVMMALGLYVLGSLNDTDAATVERHLLMCGPCRAEYERLAVLPAYLDIVANDEASELTQARRLAGRDPRRLAQWWRCDLFRNW
jgi:hypothetical protein